MLNPITRLMVMYRDILLYHTIPSISDFLLVTGFALTLMIVGSGIFNKLSRKFAEEV
jgi:lipopolysaccharide transport system permease protein